MESAKRPPRHTQVSRPAVRLICVGTGTGTGTQEYGAAWQAGLAPEIEVVRLPLAATPPAPLPEGLADLLDDRPYAVFGRGPWALAALEVSRALSRVRPPAQLQVASCSAPPGTADVISWPVTAFAMAGPEPDQAGGMAMWRSVTTGPFTLRLLPDHLDHPDHPDDLADGWADAGTLLAIKEELRVWPR